MNNHGGTENTEEKKYQQEVAEEAELKTCHCMFFSAVSASSCSKSVVSVLSVPPWLVFLGWC